MNQSTKEGKKELTPTGRVKKGRTKKELKEYFKLRSREYYSTPEMKEKQRLKVAAYREKNRDIINERQRKKSKRVNFEKKLKKIWIARGLIK
jgi:hypothetical protein